MNRIINKPVSLAGTLRVPSDRSITVRAVQLAGLAEGTSSIREPLASDDTDACITCVKDLGVPISSELNPHSTLTINGVGLHGFRAPQRELFCGSSGTTIRLLAGLLAGQRFDSVLEGTAQLRKRPMRRIIEPLSMMGAHIVDNAGCAPLHISAATGPLKAITYHTPVASAQLKAAILLAGLYATDETVVIEDAPTRDHTERILAAMGAQVQCVSSSPGRWTSRLVAPRVLKPLNITVPADFSSAAFFMVAATIVPGSNIELREVGINPTRTGLLDALRAMGANITLYNQRDEGGEPVADVRVLSAKLHATDEVAGTLTARSIDELPVLAVAATQAIGPTVVRDAQELRVKESNRLEGYVTELHKMGANISSTKDGFVIEGPTQLKGASVDGMGDHRVAMSLAVAALVAEGPTTIFDVDCVSKTYPQFFKDLDTLMETPSRAQKSAA